MIGYPKGTNPYRLWSPETKSVVRSRNVKFLNEINFRNTQDNNNDAIFSEEKAKEEDVSHKNIENISSVTKYQHQKRGSERPRIVKAGLPNRPKNVYRKNTNEL